MGPRLAPAPALLERSAKAELRVVVHRVFLDHGLELDRGVRIAARAEVGASQRLANRGLLGLHLACLLQRDDGSGEIAVLEQVAAALEQLVDALGALFGRLAHAGASLRARICSTTSTIAAAMADFGPRGTFCAPLAVTIVT